MRMPDGHDNNADRQYLYHLQNLLENGIHREGRNGGTLSLFGAQMRFDLEEGFPILTTKEIWWHGVRTELLWFLRGDSNVKYLHDNNVHIWDEWADDNGELGPVYGKQWRSWATPGFYGEGGGPGTPVDQIAGVIKSLRENPASRRHVVTAWNPAEVDDMALPPCHCLFQFYVAGGKLSCHLYQRSADWFIGVPFNIASYALLTHLIAREVGLGVRDLVMSFGDSHLYDNHREQADEQLERKARLLPKFAISNHAPEGLEGLKPFDLALIGYDPHPHIRAEISK